MKQLLIERNFLFYLKYLLFKSCLFIESLDYLFTSILEQKPLVFVLEFMDREDAIQTISRVDGRLLPTGGKATACLVSRRQFRRFYPVFYII